MLNWWNNIPKHINPNIVEIGSFQLRYYGLMYVVAFTIIYLLALYRLKNEKYEFSKEIIQNYFAWAIIGVLVGGRLGYVLFYNFEYFVAKPLEMICPFDISNGFQCVGISGMSYHGGVIGVILVSILFCRKYRMNFWHLSDLLCPAIPLGYTFGRLGNFINGELYGRVTTVLWGMYFPLDPTHQLRHPSQLYEAFFEGIFLFLILWSLRKTKVFDGFLFCLYLIGYGIVRFFIEFVREPDSQLGFVFGSFTMGQILCVCMIFIGVFILIICINRMTIELLNR
ncbi:MAG: prolipoprotein diacylglyceryl transferase [Candidatus Marinimicrobia bacterium]|nr:prolipoprotein diacylglyceryl transferase [bacterium]MCG2716497.1 prolipoprotein diacylglyceryl transferase [Candidatus Neomarinimicrobiota bacterium]